MKDEILVITGGNGFLGRHILENFPLFLKTSKYYSNHQANNNNDVNSSPKIIEIRSLDVTYTQEDEMEDPVINHEYNFTIKKICADILNYPKLSQCIAGSTGVIHCASLIYHKSSDHLLKVNIEGTKNVIAACHEHSVTTLIYTSTVDVIIGFDLGSDPANKEIITECAPYPDVPLFTMYGSSKKEAEIAVLKANSYGVDDLAHDINPKNHNSSDTTKGKLPILATACLRPCAIYGPNDSYFITESIRQGIRGVEPYLWFGGPPLRYHFPRLNIGHAKYQAVYVGNVAWAHLKALEALKLNPEDAGGKMYFIADETPIQSVYHLVKPFFDVYDIKFYDRVIPSFLLHISAKFLRIIFNICPTLQKFFPISLSALIYLYSSHVASYSRSRKLLGYEPIYDYETALARSLEFYQKLPEEMLEL